MPNPTTEARLITLLAEVLGTDAARITTDLSLFTDLAVDSLDLVEIVMSTEEEFGFEIRDDDMERIRTVADLLALIPSEARTLEVV